MIFGLGNKKKQQKKKKGSDNFRESVLKVNTRAFDGRLFRLRRLGSGALLGIGALLLMLAVYFSLLKVSGLLFFENDFFRLRRIEVTNSGDVIERDLVLSHPAFRDCSNIFDLNMNEFRTGFMEQYPRVKSMEIQRQLPGTLKISIEERTPIARLEMPANQMEIDADAIVLGGWRGAANLPLIRGHAIYGARKGVNLSGTAVMDAIQVVTVSDRSEFGGTIRIDSVNVSDREQIEVRLRTGERAKIAWQGQGYNTPDSIENLFAKLKMLEDSMLTLAQKGHKIVEIDLTLDRNIPAKTKSFAER